MSTSPPGAHEHAAAPSQTGLDAAIQVEVPSEVGVLNLCDGLTARPVIGTRAPRATARVDSEADAQAEEFVGSPTIRIDGRDVQPPGDEPTGLTCRVYRRRDGRISPTPDPADLRDALRAASSISSGRS